MWTCFINFFCRLFPRYQLLIYAFQYSNLLHHQPLRIFCFKNWIHTILFIIEWVKDCSLWKKLCHLWRLFWNRTHVFGSLNWQKQSATDIKPTLLLLNNSHSDVHFALFSQFNNCSKWRQRFLSFSLNFHCFNFAFNVNKPMMFCRFFNCKSFIYKESIY